MRLMRQIQQASFKLYMVKKSILFLSTNGAFTDTNSKENLNKFIETAYSTFSNTIQWNLVKIQTEKLTQKRKPNH